MRKAKRTRTRQEMRWGGLGTGGGLGTVLYCCIFFRWLGSLGSSFLAAFYHVVARSIERPAIFRDVRDRRWYLELLAERVERFGVRLFAYCLMGNCVHLAVETGRAPGRERSTTVREVRYLEERLASDFRFRRTVHRIQTRLG